MEAHPSVLPPSEQRGLLGKEPPPPRSHKNLQAPAVATLRFWSDLFGPRGGPSASYGRQDPHACSYPKIPVVRAVGDTALRAAVGG